MRVSIVEDMSTQNTPRFATIRLNDRGAWRPIAVTSFSEEGGEGKLLAEFPYKEQVTSTELDSLPTVSFSADQLGPVVPNPGKIFCVGLNYREHIAEMGHPIPDHPTLFVKYASALAGPFDEVVVPPELSAQADYEGELAVIMGEAGQIAGYAVMNDFSQRDWQYRTQQWLQGKNLDRSSGFGPWMVPAEHFDPVAEGAVLRTWVNGELRQEHSVADLVFKPQDLVDYISNFASLAPGDVIVTGTPEGVGHGMTPPQYLADGDEVRIAIDGIGEICNRINC